MPFSRFGLGRRRSTIWACFAWISSIALTVCIGAESRRDSDRITDDQVVGIFCGEAKLFDRGVSNTPFAGVMDNWVVHLISESKSFVELLGATESQVKELRKRGPNGRPWEKDDINKLALTNHDTVNGTCRYDLDEVLTGEQKRKLPAIYLDLEGLSSLRRECFQNLLGMSPDKQRKIVSLINDFEYNKSDPLHKAIFTLSSKEMSNWPEIRLRLRILSAELDLKILDILSDAERKKLIPIARQAYEQQPLVTGPGT
jgi:hypothetical protein